MIYSGLWTLLQVVAVGTLWLLEHPVSPLETGLLRRGLVQSTSHRQLNAHVLQAGLLFVNAVAILNNDRFLENSEYIL